MEIKFTNLVMEIILANFSHRLIFLALYKHEASLASNTFSTLVCCPSLTFRICVQFPCLTWLEDFSSKGL